MGKNGSEEEMVHCKVNEGGSKKKDSKTTETYPPHSAHPKPGRQHIGLHQCPWVYTPRKKEKDNMPSFLCPTCGKRYPNMVLMRRCLGGHLNQAADLAKDEGGEAKTAWAAFVGSNSLLGAQRNFATLKKAAGATPLPEFTSKIHSARQFFAQLDQRKTDGCRASGCGYNCAGDPCAGVKVVVVGCGPAGIRTSIELRMLGADVYGRTKAFDSRGHCQSAGTSSWPPGSSPSL